MVGRKATATQLFNAGYYFFCGEPAVKYNQTITFSGNYRTNERFFIEAFDNQENRPILMDVSKMFFNRVSEQCLKVKYNGVYVNFTDGRIETFAPWESDKHNQREREMKDAMKSAPWNLIDDIRENLKIEYKMNPLQHILWARQNKFQRFRCYRIDFLD